MPVFWTRIGVDVGLLENNKAHLQNKTEMISGGENGEDKPDGGEALESGLV